MRYGKIIVLAALLGMTACKNEQKGQDVTQTGEKTVEKTEAAERNVVRKRISTAADFSYITNLGSVDIIYTQGDYNLEAEGDSVTLNFLKTEIDSHLLTVTVHTDNNTDLNQYGNTSNIKLYVSCPELRCVSICGNGSFTSKGPWNAEQLQFGGMGTGELNVEQVECQKCDIQTNDVGKITFGELKAKDVMLLSYGSADIDLNILADSLMVLNEGKQHLHLKGNVQTAIIKRQDDPNLVNELNVLPYKKK